jgi:large subunit ribosomal protein L28
MLAYGGASRPEKESMATRCELCGKGVTFGHNVSHSNRKTNRRWLPNVQKTMVVVNGSRRRINACTRCIRTLRKAPV